MESFMRIHGLQKMTLLDFPGHVACTVFLGGCDLLCPYCHNYELATGQAPAVMEEEELFAFLAKRKGLLDGVAITGGEPCLHRNLPEFIAKIREMGYPVKLDTNGTHPALLREILEKGLVEYAAMDVKNSPSKKICPYCRCADFGSGAHFGEHRASEIVGDRLRVPDDGCGRTARG